MSADLRFYRGGMGLSLLKPTAFPRGDDRIRTGDLLVANQALFQLSYIPEPTCGSAP
jgi:hypothetical protein